MDDVEEPVDKVDNIDLYEDLDLFCSTRSITECSLSYTEVSDETDHTVCDLLYVQLQEKLKEKEVQLSALKLEVQYVMSEIII